MWLPADAKPQGGDEYLFTCYNCERFKFAYNTTKQTGHCLRCESTAGGEAHLRKLYSSGVEVVQRTEPLKASFVREEEDRFIPAYSHPECAAYLRGRNVDEDLAEACGALYRNNRVWFPLTNYVYPNKAPLMMSRSIEDGAKGYRSTTGERAECLFGKRPRGEMVVLTEGPFDALRLWGTAMAVCGKALSDSLQWWLIDNYRQCILWLDPDGPGKRGAEVLKDMLADKLRQREKLGMINNFRLVDVHEHWQLEELGDTETQKAHDVLRSLIRKMKVAV